MNLLLNELHLLLWHLLHWLLLWHLLLHQLLLLDQLLLLHQLLLLQLSLLLLLLLHQLQLRLTLLWLLLWHLLLHWLLKQRWEWLLGQWLQRWQSWRSLGSKRKSCWWCRRHPRCLRQSHERIHRCLCWWGLRWLRPAHHHL